MSVGLTLLVIVTILVLLGVCRGVLDKMGLTDRQALALTAGAVHRRADTRHTVGRERVRESGRRGDTAGHMAYICWCAPEPPRSACARW